MTAKKPSKSQQRPTWGKVMRGQVDAVQERLHKFQTNTEKALKGLGVQGRKSSKALRRELDLLVARLEKAGWGDGPAKFSGQAKGTAKKLGSELALHLEDLHTKAVEFVGVASREQVAGLSRDIKRLASKLDALIKTR